MAALGMGEQDPVALALEVEQDRVEAGDGGGEGRLDQQPRPGAEVQALELRGLDVDQADHRDLRSGAHLECDPLDGQARVQLLHERQDRDGVVGVLPADVWGGHEHARARVRGATSERERALDRLGAVVDAGEHMAVQVDHCHSNTMPG